MASILGAVGIALWAGPADAVSAPRKSSDLRLVPYPQEIKLTAGTLPIGPPRPVTEGKPSPTEQTAIESLTSYLPDRGKPIPVRLGSVEKGYTKSWLSPRQRSFLQKDETSPEASVLSITPKGITVIGKAEIGMLYAAQTVNQLAVQAAHEGWAYLPCLEIRDWPDMRWRCLSPAMTWYSGYNRLEGYDLCNWTLEEWKWLADWSLLHKCNGWALCMYGHWPFTLPGHESNCLDVDSFFYNPETGSKKPWRFAHRNITNEFLPELIRYANERGIKVYAYIGKNSFNGTYWKTRPEMNAGGAAELLPFGPGVHEYWDALIGRILEIGFNGFVFEDPEANHVPNQTEECYKAFWEPWASKYGYKSREETDANKPPLGVHFEYYTWLFREFDALIQKHAARLRVEPEVYLISHILLSRMMNESKDQTERRAWVDLMDAKHGHKVAVVVAESNETDYARLLGPDRVASLGGRGGSCTCAMRRIASVNNNWTGGPMSAGVDWERGCQRRIYEAGGFGAMGYIFEWTNAEVFGYIAAQHLWRNSGVPGINNEDQFGFLDYAYGLHYGEEVGRLVARAMDEGSCVNDAMVLEGVYGSQFPETGRPLHRDYQYLAALADGAAELADKAYKLYTGRQPDLYHADYDTDVFRWRGFDPQADKLFKSERLRLLCVSAARSQRMCEAALAHRKAERLMAEGASIGSVLQALDRAIEAAKANQPLYQLNYDDDYDWTDGLCAKVTETLEKLRADFLAACGPDSGTERPVPDEVRGWPTDPKLIPWEKLSDILPVQRNAGQPGIYLSVNLGLDQKPDYYKLGVVFTAMSQQQDGGWQTIFRRGINRRATGWEHWDIPLDGLKGTTKLRFVTDSYTRAQQRDWPSWKWAVWGRPQIVEVTPGGERRVLYDFTERIDHAKTFVRLDADGRERPFDAAGKDSTGATFAATSPGPLDRLRAGEGRARQWVSGFADLKSAPHIGDYRSYLGVVRSGWAYASEGGAVGWVTDAVPRKQQTFVVFVGGADYTPGRAELYCNGKPLLSFPTPNTADARWEADGVELHYIHGGDTRDERTTYGLSGVFVLSLPPSLVTAGKPLNLSLKTAGGGWIMVHGYRDPMQATRQAVLPQPEMPAIAAFTPHASGAAGVTIGEFEIELPQRLK